MLAKIPLADKGAGIKPSVGEGVITVMQAQALLVDLLTGIQPGGKAAGLLPVLVSLLTGQATRVLGYGGIHGGEKDSDRAGVGKIPAGLTGELIFADLTLFAKPLVIQSRQAEGVLALIISPRSLHIGLF